MREAFSRLSPTASGRPILRAGDGGQRRCGRVGRRRACARASAPTRARGHLRDLKVAAGTLWTELKKQVAAHDFNVEQLNDAFAKGFSGTGSVAAQLEKVIKSTGLEYSVQDGEVQVLGAGDVLGVEALVLTPETGLEGSVEVDAQGTMHCRVRLVPGLSPGYPVQVRKTKPLTLETGFYAFDLYDGAGDSTIYRIEKTRYVGDTHGQDWVAEIDCRDAVLPPKVKATKKAAATP